MTSFPARFDVLGAVEQWHKNLSTAFVEPN